MPTKKKASSKKTTMVPVVNGSGKVIAAMPMGSGFKLSGQGTAQGGAWNPFKHAKRDFQNIGKALAPVASFVAPKIPAIVAAIQANQGNPFAMGVAGARALTGLGRRKPRR